jgi:4-hydroxy-4-methyl-2-oxoglutarate aldolase
MMDEIQDRLARLATPELSDALDRLGIDGQALGVAPLDRGFRTVGRAFTVRMLPAGLSGKSVGDYIDDVYPGQVVVIDNGGRLDATVWGDILTTVAHRDGIAGTVIDGVCRDASRSLELRYPIFARANTMRTGKDRVAAEEYGCAVQLSGVRVEAQDWIVGDADGVVVIPEQRVGDVLDTAEYIWATEEQSRRLVEDGAQLVEARKQVGYHSLQTRVEP